MILWLIGWAIVTAILDVLEPKATGWKHFGHGMSLLLMWPFCLGTIIGDCLLPMYQSKVKENE